MVDQLIRAQFDFSNTPGATPTRPILPGGVAVQQADGKLLSRKPDGTTRETDIRDIVEQLANGPLAVAFGLKADLVNGIVPVAQLPPGFDGGGGAPSTVTASQITDASPSGSSVLTGTPEQGRTALEIAFGTAAGTFAQGNDPRFSFVPSANGYTDPKAFGAKGDGVTDDSAAWQQAINTGKVVVPSEGDYLINTTVNLPASTVINVGGHGLSRRVKVRTTANVDTFNATGGNGAIQGLAFYHSGAFGRCFKQNNEGSWHVHHNYFNASNSGSVASDIIHTSGALSWYYRNAFDNFRNNVDSFCIAFDKSPNDANHCIENGVHQNYCGGAPGASGPFLYIGSRVGRAANAYNPNTKPEGIHVSSNTVQTHSYSVVVECVLLLHLTNNSFTIGNGVTMLLRPTGPGIIDLRSTSNWYDSSDNNNVNGIITSDESYRNGPASVIKTARFQDFFYQGKYGAVFGPNASGIDFTGSSFLQITSVGIICNGTKNVTIASDFESTGKSVQLYDNADGGPFFIGKCNFTNSPPEFIMTDRSKFIMSYETSGYKVARKFPFATSTASGWLVSAMGANSVKNYILVAHGLVGTPNPNKCHVTCQAVNGGSLFEGATAFIAGVDANNITLGVLVFAQSNPGTIVFNMDVSM